MSDIDFTKHINIDNTRLITTNLSTDINDKLKEIAAEYQSKASDGKIFTRLFSRESHPKYSMNKGISYTFAFDEDSATIPENLMYIKVLAHSLLTKAGFKVSADDGTIEIYYYEVKQDEKGQTTFSIHTDDEGLNCFPVETCMFYIQKDEGIINGNLDYYVKDPEANKGWFAKILSSFTDGEKHELKIKSGIVALMSGNLSHCPQEFTGVGERKCIVVQLKSLERN